MSYNQAEIVEAIKAFEAGEIVVVVDDDDRENEGDLIVAAVHCTTEKMAFIVRYSGGVVCAPMTPHDARRLNLSQMVADNDAPHATAFTVSVDFKHETTTGISADDRNATVRALANNNNGAVDFVKPGHIFPLVAKEGGVLMRSGHTEAAVDLCKLAGLEPVGVISELMNDDGSVMRGPQINEFAKIHNLKMISVANLISYRQRQESLIERVEEFDLETPNGKATAITYTTPWDPMQHVAMIYGDIRDGENIPVRLHIESVLGDVFGTSSSLQQSMNIIQEKGRGVVIYLREGAVGVANTGSWESLTMPESMEDHGSAKDREGEWLEIGLGAQIVKDLGIQSIELIASRERHYVGLEGFGIEIANTLLTE